MPKSEEDIKIEADYDKVRSGLCTIYRMMDNPDPAYLPTLMCSECGCYRKHRPDGSKKTTVEWIAEGEKYSSTRVRNIYKCMDCGAERAYGVNLGREDLQ